MKALTATITVLLDPRVIGPDAEGDFGGSLAQAHASDYVSALLSERENATVLDWTYRDIQEVAPGWPTAWKEVELDPAQYQEGDLFGLQQATT